MARFVFGDVAENGSVKTQCYMANELNFVFGKHTKLENVPLLGVYNDVYNYVKNLKKIYVYLWKLLIIIYE